MSYNIEDKNVYMVEFQSGRNIHVQFFDLDEVKKCCASNYSGETIKSIYKEVFYNDEREFCLNPVEVE
jgi:hypothetical protein